MAKPKRIKKSTPVPRSTTGFWINATDWFTINKCVDLLKQSTGSCGSDPHASVGVYLQNIFWKRAALWLWTSFTWPTQFMTVAFHGADGPTRRFCVCAGVDGSLGCIDTYNLWIEAVRQFAKINKVAPDGIFLWYATGEQPKTGDRILDAFNQISSSNTTGLVTATYVQTDARWPVSQYAWQFNTL